MELLIAFTMGAAYTLGGLYLASIAADMPGSKLRAFIGNSMPRSLLVIVLWPVAVSFAAGHAYRLAKRAKSVRL